jgi:hypothetical protein
MLDIYKFHTEPDQLHDYAVYQKSEAAKKAARTSQYRQPNMPDATEEYLNEVQEVKGFFEFHKPNEFVLEEYEHMVNGVRTTMFTMYHPHGHMHDGVAFRLAVCDREEGRIKLYDPDHDDMIGEYNSLDAAAEDGEIFDKMEYVIDHYDYV